jgi:hypothetical protein
MIARSFDMKKKLKKIFLILGSIILFFLLLIVTAVLLFFYQKPLIKNILVKQIEKRAGIHVTVGSLDYGLFPLRIEADRVEFATSMGQTEVDVFVEKLLFKGDIHRIRKKIKPYFDTIESEGLRIISDVKVSRKKISFEDLFRSLPSLMSYTKKIDMKNAFSKFSFSGKSLTLQGIDLTLSSAGSQAPLAYSFLCRDAEGIGRLPTDRLQSSMKGSGTVSLGNGPGIDGRFAFTSNRLLFAAKKGYLEEIDLNFNGEYIADTDKFIFSHLEIEIPTLLNCTGSLDVNVRDDLTLVFRPSLRIDDLGRFFSLAGDYLPQQIDGLELEGTALFEGIARITPTHPERKASIEGQVTLAPSPLKYRTPEFHIDGYISGRFKLAGFPDNRNISGRAMITKSSFTGKSLKAHGIGMDIPFALDLEKYKISVKSLKGSAATLRLDHANAKLKIDDPKFFGQGVIDLKKRRLLIPKAGLEINPFPPIAIEVDAGLTPDDSKSFSVRSSRIGFQSLIDFFSFAIPGKIREWEPEGWLDIHLQAHDFYRQKEKAWQVSAELAAGDVNFHDPSYAVAAEALRANLILEGTLDRSLKEIPFKTRFKLSGGESLWKDFYIDWKKLPLESTVSARFQVSGANFEALSLEAAIPGLGRIAAEGKIDLKESRSAYLQFTASALQLGPLYTFIGQKRAAERTEVKLKGEAESQLGVKINKNDFSLLGHLKIKNASWAGGNRDFSFQGMEASIPIDYESSPSPTGDEIPAATKGYIVVQKFRLPYMDFPNLRFDISCIRNGYSIQPLEVEIFDSKTGVGEISVDYDLSPFNFRALTSLEWRETDLPELPFSSPDFRTEGTWAAHFPRVEITPDLVSAEGQAEVNAFGGTISIQNIHVQQPFSASRTVSCDIKLSSLNLEKITDSIPFGRVTGIINGEIHDLALSYGQPERFDIRLESKKTKGVPQRFSLKATNDLAILGTGEKTPFSPHKGWTRFVKEFRYNKIGIACTLKNDIFSLQGTIRKKGVEYLVRGSGLFSINVVNKQVRNQIRFEDMLNRLKRIGQSKQYP